MVITQQKIRMTFYIHTSEILHSSQKTEMHIAQINQNKYIFISLFLIRLGIIEMKHSYSMYKRCGKCLE